jgi:hypothetical protein
MTQSTDAGEIFENFASLRGGSSSYSDLTLNSCIKNRNLIGDRRKCQQVEGFGKEVREVLDG